MRAERNDPCPCGSGKKYKKCHLRIDEREPAQRPVATSTKKRRLVAERQPPAHILEELQRRIRAESERRATFGEVRAVVHTDFQGYKVVAVGSTIHWSKNWRTFADFLFYYIAKVLGHTWGQEELAKPRAKRHVILQWYEDVEDFKNRHEAGPDGLKSAEPDGPTRAYLALAYDLFLVANDLLLQTRLIERIKNRDQFQGARYELAVAATMMRAGFELQLEDETDTSRKHAEFTAKHARSGEVVAVEAKSRHRHGVLGQKGSVVTREQFRLGITDQLRKAIAKEPAQPYLIFIDANMPPDIASQHEKWLKEVGQALVRVGHGFSEVGVYEGTPFNGLVITNWPDHYGEKGAALPPGIGFTAEPIDPIYPLGDRTILVDIRKAIEQYGIIPSAFPD